MQYPRFLNCKQSVWSVSWQFIDVTEAGVVGLLVVGASVVGAGVVGAWVIGPTVVIELMDEQKLQDTGQFVCI